MTTFKYLVLLLTSFIAKNNFVRACRNNPVDCAVSKWSDWTACSVTCGNGKQTRSRTITTHPEHGGRACGSLNSEAVCYKQRCEVNCLWGEWSTWSACTSCGIGGRSRYRPVQQPSVFNGKECTASSIDIDYSCEPQDTCISKYDQPCGSGYFKCSYGKCIQNILKCNGDNDCGDNSDERDCVDVLKPCGEDSTSLIPGIYMTGIGYDALTGERKSNILDNEKYEGSCVKIYDHSTQLTFRKPWNIQDYYTQVEASENMYVEGYTSSKQYRSERITSMGKKFTFSVALGVLSASVSLSNSHETKKVITSSEDGASTYFDLQNDIQVGTFRTRDNSLVLSRSFEEAVEALPDQFDYEKYTNLFRSYGTHYLSEGKLGGKLTYVFTYSNRELRSSNLTFDEEIDCLSSEISIAMFGGEAGIHNSRCQTSSDSTSHEESFISTATDITSRVIGGSPVTAGSLSFSEGSRPSPEKFEAWAKEVKHNPDVTDFKLKEITGLMPTLAKRQNAERALSEYMQQYNPENCQVTCQNGGDLVVTNEGRECHCLCCDPYYGYSCGLMD